MRIFDSRKGKSGHIQGGILVFHPVVEFQNKICHCCFKTLWFEERSIKLKIILR
jgi:hypothetical protein